MMLNETIACASLTLISKNVVISNGESTISAFRTCFFMCHLELVAAINHNFRVDDRH